jgi:hypothetical protein
MHRSAAPWRPGDGTRRQAWLRASAAQPDDAGAGPALDGRLTPDAVVARQRGRGPVAGRFGATCGRRLGAADVRPTPARASSVPITPITGTTTPLDRLLP